MDRKDFFFRQRVTQAELDGGFLTAEVADRNVVKDILGTGFLISGPNPATVIQDTVPGSNIRANVFLGYDQLGQRISNLRSGYQGGVNKGVASQLIDMLVDEVAAATTVGSAGNEKTLSIFVQFRRNPSDPRTDGNGAPINFVQDESIQFNVVQSAEAAVGASVPPPLRADQILLADVTRIFAQTTFLNSDIDQSRRQAFALSLLHGGTHAEGAADPVPNSTPGVGGLLSAANHTLLNTIGFGTAAGIAAVFNNQFRDFQPANATSPAAATLDVTSTFLAETPGGSASVEGVVTTAPDNLVILRRANGDDFLETATADRNKVQGRLTEAAAVWTLSFFFLDEATGAETPFDMTPFAGTAIVWFVQKAFRLNNLPSANPARSIPSDQIAAEVPDGSETVKGKVEFAPVGGVTALEAVQASDTRLGVITALQNAGVPLAPGLFSTLNFLGGGLLNLGGGVASIPAASGPLQSAFFQYAAVTSVNTGALGFTPLAAIIISSNGSYLGVGIFKGSGAADQSAGSFNTGLGNIVLTGRVDAFSLWTCTQFTAAGVIASGASTTGALLVIGQ